MKCNVGKNDRLLRIGAGVVILYAGVHFQSLWGLIGLVPLFTAIVRWCPAYVPFGIETK